MPSRQSPFWGLLANVFSRRRPPSHIDAFAAKEGEQASAFVTIDGDVQLCVPCSLKTMTSYILLEQEDWFEDEIRFVRRLLGRGMHVIDIGANHGVYTLSMAKAVGGEGRVWAFEPARDTAALLGASVARNGFAHVQVIHAALADREGEGVLGMDGNSELNRLLQASESAVTQEVVQLRTLDACASELGWTDIAFIKLDAEGAEWSIIQGGDNFLAMQSPLIMAELKHADSYNFSMLSAFAERGYLPYRLMPGLHVLTPFDIDGEIDPYQLNLFFCKADRARLLQQAGWLARTEDKALAAPVKDGWRARLSPLPYAKRLSARWNACLKQENSAATREYLAALDAYALARNGETPAAIRVSALNMAIESLPRLKRIEELGFCRREIDNRIRLLELRKLAA
jgi:FkbM family methyltransferase